MFDKTHNITFTQVQHHYFFILNITIRLYYMQNAVTIVLLNFKTIKKDKHLQKQLIFGGAYQQFDL